VNAGQGTAFGIDVRCDPQVPGKKSHGAVGYQKNILNLAVKGVEQPVEDAFALHRQQQFISPAETGIESSGKNGP
jgi:hypothetical protein